MKGVILVGGLLLAAGVQRDAALAPDWRHWEYSAPIAADVSQARLVRVLVPETVARRVLPQFADLRVIDDRGTEVPFVLHARVEHRTRERRPARLQDVTHGPDENARATVDVGEGSTHGAALHNAIEIQTPLDNFSARVAIDVSRDGARWRKLVEGAPIYRFAQHDLAGNQTVRYIDNTSRYLRLRITVTDGADTFPLTGARVWHEVVQEPELIRVEATFHTDRAAPGDESWWLADRGAPGQPVSQIVFAVGQETFHRPVRVRTGDDGRTWRTSGGGDVYRLVGRDGKREKLRVGFDETRARWVRVEIVNRSDAPLADLQLDLMGTPRRVVFRAEPGRHYLLLYGNPRAKAAEYEMIRVVSAADLAAAASVLLGEGSVNPGYADPAPWTERHPAVLWMALLVAVAVLGTLAIRALRTAAS